MPIDMSLASKAPPAKTPGVTRSGTRSPRMTQEEKRAQAVNGVFQLAQAGCVMTGNFADAAAIGMHGEAISTEVVGLAAINDGIAKAVDYLTEAGPYAGLITAVLPLALQVLANHKRIPADKVPGVTDPDVLTSQMQSAMALQAAQERQAAQEQMKLAQNIMANMEAEASPNGSRSNGEAPGDAP